MLLLYFLVSFFTTTLSIGQAVYAIPQTSGGRLPPERITASLDLVLATINDFYVPIYSFPEDGSYDLDSWFIHTRNYSDAINTARHTLEALSPLETEVALHVVDFAGNYIYHDLVAVLEEVRTRRFDFYEISIEPHVVLATMDKWLTETTLFHNAVLRAVTINTDDDFERAFEELNDAFDDVFEEYQRELAPHPSWLKSFVNLLLAWRWTS